MGESQNSIVALGIIFIVSAAILLPILLFLVISLLREFCCIKKQTTQNLYKYATIMTFVSSILYIVSQTSSSIIIVSSTNNGSIFISRPEVNSEVAPLFVLGFMSYLSFFLTTYCIYFILVLRVYYTFQNSIYEFERYKIYVHAANCAVMVILNIILLIFVQSISGYYIFVLWIILLTIGYVHLLYVFNHNLFLLVLTQRQTIVNNKQELNERQIKLLTTIRKHTILGSYIVFVNVMFGLFIIMISSIAQNKVNEVGFVLIYFGFVICWFSFLLVGPLCIYLGYGQNQELYMKCCRLCDNKCKNICIEFAERKINQPPELIDTATPQSIE